MKARVIILLCLPYCTLYPGKPFSKKAHISSDSTASKERRDPFIPCYIFEMYKFIRENGSSEDVEEATKIYNKLKEHFRKNPNNAPNPAQQSLEKKLIFIKNWIKDLLITDEKNHF